MPDVTWMHVPSDLVLTDQNHWKSLGGSEYSAIRAHLLLLRRRSPSTKRGPVLKHVELPGGVKYSLEHKKLIVIKQTENIVETIQSTVSSKLTTEFAKKITAQAGLDKGLPTGGLNDETSMKFGSELTDSLQKTLATTKAYEVQYSEEITRSITLETHNGKKRQRSLDLYFYTNLWPWSWDIYLHQIEYLKLSYKQRWYWKDVRKTLEPLASDVKCPLLRASYYEPQDECSIAEGKYKPEVEEDIGLQIEMLNGSYPKVSPPISSTLEDLAKLAFPVTELEKSAAQKAKPKTASGYGTGPRFASKAKRRSFRSRAPSFHAKRSMPRKKAQSRTRSRKSNPRRARKMAHR
jgi:hypothetical protein